MLVCQPHVLGMVISEPTFKGNSVTLTIHYFFESLICIFTFGSKACLTAVSFVNALDKSGFCSVRLDLVVIYKKNKSHQLQGKQESHFLLLHWHIMMLYLMP